MELPLSDSWARLDWVRTLIGRVAPIVAAIDDQLRGAPVVFEFAANGEFEHARYMLDGPVPVPDAVGFTIADIAVNARSCLDMAITAVVDAYGLPIRRPYFPIEDNIAVRQEPRIEKLLAAVPAPFTQVLNDLQPIYETPWGRMGIPINRSALMIREISNANKHRNITPTVRTQTSGGFLHHPGLGAALLPAGARSRWPHSDGTIALAAQRRHDLGDSLPHRNGHRRTTGRAGSPGDSPTDGPEGRPQV